MVFMSSEFRISDTALYASTYTSTDASEYLQALDSFEATAIARENE